MTKKRTNNTEERARKSSGAGREKNTVELGFGISTAPAPLTCSMSAMTV